MAENIRHWRSSDLLKVETEKVTADNVHQSVYYPANEEKMPLLVGLLREIGDGRVMVFTNTRSGADKIGRTLNANGISAAVISGRVPQKKRQSLLKRFHDDGAQASDLDLDATLGDVVAEARESA